MHVLGVLLGLVPVREFFLIPSMPVGTPPARALAKQLKAIFLTTRGRLGNSTCLGCEVVCHRWFSLLNRPLRNRSGVWSSRIGDEIPRIDALEQTCARAQRAQGQGAAP
jgi:hypothetical protein